MKQRVIRFHRVYPNKRVAVTSLRRLYLKHGIRRKKLRQEKVIPSAQKLHYAENCREVLTELNGAKVGGRLLIYLDEITFTKRSLLAREWS